jgi:hypothetical protein
MKISQSRHFTVAWYWLIINGWFRTNRSAMLRLASEDPLQEHDAAGQSQEHHRQFEHPTPHLPPEDSGNSRPAMGAAQSVSDHIRVTVARSAGEKEHLRYRDRETEPQEQQSEFHHATPPSGSVPTECHRHGRV